MVRDHVAYGKDNINTDHLDLFLAAAQSSGLTLHSLAIRHTQELLRSVHPISLRALHRLDLKLGCYEWPRAYRERTNWPFSTWFHTLDNLEEL